MRAPVSDVSRSRLRQLGRTTLPLLYLDAGSFDGVSRLAAMRLIVAGASPVTRRWPMVDSLSACVQSGVDAVRVSVLMTAALAGFLAGALCALLALATTVERIGRPSYQERDV